LIERLILIPEKISILGDITLFPILIIVYRVLDVVLCLCSGSEYIMRELCLQKNYFEKNAENHLWIMSVVSCSA
jgi:hypothetical protein